MSVGHDKRAQTLAERLRAKGEHLQIPTDADIAGRIDRAIKGAMQVEGVIQDAIGAASMRREEPERPERKERAINPGPPIGPDTPLRLADIIPIAFPHGGMSVSGLRREAKRGRLAVEVIANKQFTTLNAIERMRSLCRADQSGQDSGSNLKNSTPRASANATPPGSSLTERSKSALAALHKTARELKKGSPNISPSSTAHPRESAAVIPLKSSSSIR
jgi:hypothetical protein